MVLQKVRCLAILVIVGVVYLGLPSSPRAASVGEGGAEPLTPETVVLSSPTLEVQTRQSFSGPVTIVVSGNAVQQPLYHDGYGIPYYKEWQADPIYTYLIGGEPVRYGYDTPVVLHGYRLWDLVEYELKDGYYVRDIPYSESHTYFLNVSAERMSYVNPSGGPLRFGLNVFWLQISDKPASWSFRISVIPGLQPIIKSVQGDCGQIDCPTEGLYALGLDGLRLPLRVDVDWRGLPPGSVDFSINGLTDSVPAQGNGVRYELDINRYLREGPNTLRIVARSGSVPSRPASLGLFGYRLPPWILRGRNAPPAIGNQSLVLELAFPGQSLSKQNPITWGFPGDLTHFQWQTNVKMALPTRGGPFEVEISRERDRARTGRQPQAFVKWLGHNLDVEYGGRLTGSLQARAPYVVVDQLGINASAAREFRKEVGIPDALMSLPPYGPVASEALYAIPALRAWLNDRANLYIKTAPELSGDFTLGFQPDWHVADAQMGLDVPMELGAEADLGAVEGRIYGGLGGKGTFGYSADDVHIAGLEAYGSGGYKFRVMWWGIEDEGRWELARYPSISPSAMLSFVPKPGDPPRWKLIGHPQGKNYAVFHAQPGSGQSFAPVLAGRTPASGAVRPADASVLVSNVYTYSEPSLAVHPSSDDALLLWVHDDLAKPVGQSQEVYFSRWNGAAWSAPAGITDDTKLDGAPQVAWAGDGRGVAVWQRLSDTLPITATWDVTTANKIEIATANYDPGSSTWSSISLLTDNGALDATPQLVRNGDGRLLAVWRQNAAGLLGGDAANADRIVAAFYDGGWGSPGIAVDGIPGLVDLGAGYGSGTATVAYTRYLTATSALTPTLQLFASTWNGSGWSSPSQLIDDSLGHGSPQVLYNTANQPLIVWLAGNELRLRNLSAGGVVTSTLPSGIGTVDEFRAVLDAAGNVVAIFTAQGIQRDLYVALYDQAHNLWGNPTPLTGDRASERYPAAGIDWNGRLLLGYAATAVTSVTTTATITGTGQAVTYTIPTEGETDLVTLAHTFSRNLTLGDAGLAVSDSHPAPGSTVVLSATVGNSGDLALDGVAVSFYDGDPGAGGSLVGTRSLATPLAAGFTSTLTTTYSVPVSGGAHTLYAVADPANAIVETDESDNTGSMPLFGPDLEVAVASVGYWGTGDVGLRALIRNIGTSVSPDTSLAFYRDGVTGTLAVSVGVPQLAPGEMITITAPWNPAGPAEGRYPLVGAVNREDFAETYKANNFYTFTVDVRPDLEVNPYSLWTTPLTATVASITATVANIGPVTATNVAVGFYRRDTLSPDALVLTRTVPLLAPGGSAQVSGEASGPLGCGVYVLADPAMAITETVRANNLASLPVEGLRCADFWSAPAMGVRPLTVVFTDTSSGENTTWQWDFGDGATSSARNPSHTYTTSGSYTVTLRASGPDGADEVRRANAVAVLPSSLEAAFGGAPTSGPAPLQVTFADQSSGSITGWSWSFGDGSASSSRNPSHTYTSPGSYTVTLSVSGPDGTDTLTRTNYVNVYRPVAAAFSAAAVTGTAPLMVGFVNQSTGDYNASQWSFGDGATSALQNPTHTYTSAGTYTVTLSVSGLGGADTLTRPGLVTVYFRLFLPIVLADR